jgi:hypothetical protein
MVRRALVGVGLFGVVAVLVAHRAEPVVAQNAKEKEVAAQLRLAQAELAQANKTITGLNQTVSQLQTQNKQLQATQQKTVTTDAKTAKGLQATIDGYQKAGLVHVVILKLKASAPSTEAQSVTDDVNNILAKLKTVRGVWVGTPSANGTPNLALTDYDLAFAMVFDDSAGLQKYLTDPQHIAFVDKHIAMWDTKVYDFEPKKPVGP